MSELEQTALHGPEDENRVFLKPVADGAGLEFGSSGASAGRAGVPLAAWGAAALIVLVVAVGFFLVGRKGPAAAPTTLQPADPYAASLPFSQLAMSESENLSGGKVTYLDGHVRNTGDRTVTGATVQVVFGNDVSLAPQVDTMPLTPVRMKEPYVDVEPMGAEPLKPGEDREFRLAFETVSDNWNQEMPVVRVIHTELR
jgi:hypothetical protein